MITPEYQYEVTRTWYVTAKTTVEAISKSNQILHHEVHAAKMEKGIHIEKFTLTATKPWLPRAPRFVRLIEFCIRTKIFKQKRYLI